MNYCLTCNISTKNAKYCSRSCSAKKNNIIPKRKKKIYKCKRCDQFCGHRRSLCDDCFIKDMTIEEATYNRGQRASSFALIRARARSIMRKEPQICFCCGYDRHVEVSHIEPISSYPLSTLISFVNRKENLLLLCPNCHWELDHGLIKYNHDLRTIQTATGALIAGPD